VPRVYVFCTFCFYTSQRPHGRPFHAGMAVHIAVCMCFKGKEFWDLDTQEKIRYSQVAKDKGGDYFKVDSFCSAL